MKGAWPSRCRSRVASAEADNEKEPVATNIARTVTRAKSRRDALARSPRPRNPGRRRLRAGASPGRSRTDAGSRPDRGRARAGRVSVGAPAVARYRGAVSDRYAFILRKTGGPELL